MIKFWISLLMFTIQLHADEGGGGDGGGGDAGSATDGGAGTAGDGSAGDTGSAGDSSNSSGSTDDGRPAGLEDSFWDGDAKQVRLDSLIKSHNDTRAMVHQKDEAVRERLMADIQAQRPPSPEKYEIKDLGIDPPEGYDIQFDPADPMMTMWKQLAFQSNLSNDQFMEGVRTWVKFGLESRPDPQAELEKLGENGTDRIQRIELLMNKHLDAEEMNRLSNNLGTAEGVVAMEKLIQGISDSRLPDIGESGGADNKALSQQELEEMMRDPRYTGVGRSRDPAYIEQVTKGFEKLYPGKSKRA